MPDLASIVASSLAGYYEEVREKVHRWVDPISTEQLWTRPHPYGKDRKSVV